jgi:hypothetical protein
MNEGQPSYQVVGVRADGSRVVLATGLLKEKAATIREVLFVANAFLYNIAEPEGSLAHHVNPTVPDPDMPDSERN